MVVKRDVAAAAASRQAIAVVRAAVATTQKSVLVQQKALAQLESTTLKLSADMPEVGEEFGGLFQKSPDPATFPQAHRNNGNHLKQHPDYSPELAAFDGAVGDH